MEEGVYRMSLTEGFLVLIIIGLWLIAVINLARKLERICNPPSIFPNYSTTKKTNFSPSTLHEHYSNNNSIPPVRSTSSNFVRALSEPNLDASPRTTIYIRSPSETHLHTKSSISEQIPSPSTLELRGTNSSLSLLRQSGYRIHIETISNKPLSSHKLLSFKRIPSIVGRSFLDLHRRALFSKTSSNTSMTQCIVTPTENRSMVIMNRFPSMKKTYRRENAIDDAVC